MLKKILILVGVLILSTGCNLPGQPPPTSTPQPLWQVKTVETTFTPVALDTPEPGDEDECEVPFYPVSDEATWTYTMSSGGNAIHTMSADTFGNFSLLIESSESTFTIGGKCTPEGVVLLDVPGVSTSYTGSEGSSALTTKSVSGLTLPKDVGIGQSWSYSVTTGNDSEIVSNYIALGFENISVPAGEFYTLKVEEFSNVKMMGMDIDFHGYHWYAEGVGVIKSAMDGAPSAELLSYDIPD